MKAAVRYGLIYAGISIGISLLTFGLGIEKEDYIQSSSTFLNIIIPAVVIFYGIKEKRDKENNGYLTFGSGFSAGMVISLIGGAITAVYTYLYVAFLNPGIVTFIKMQQEQEMYERGMSDAEVERIVSSMDIWANPGVMAAFVLVGALIIGLVISLILAAILKKENPSEIM